MTFYITPTFFHVDHPSTLGGQAFFVDPHHSLLDHVVELPQMAQSSDHSPSFFAFKQDKHILLDYLSPW